MSIDSTYDAVSGILYWTTCRINTVSSFGVPQFKEDFKHLEQV